MSILTKWLESMHVDMEITKRCSRKRNHRSSCQFCLDACKTGAISIEGQEIHIDLDLCNSCGDCMVSCPLSAIEGISVLRIFDNRSLQYSDQYKISDKELLIYKEKGIQTIMTVSRLNEQWTSAIEEANQKLVLLEERPFTVTGPDGGNLSKRELFSFIKKQGRQLGKDLSPAAWKIQSGEWILTNYFSDYQFYTVQVDVEKCSLCQACFHFCTQNVFLLEDSALQIDHGKCVNCTDCTDLCPQSALRIIPEIKKKAISSIAVIYHTCQKCGTVFPSFHNGEHACHICKERNPEWLSPIG
ncbi:4Fe-4S dicluster domain-containing protein [Neobacillus dielmonensis]|uniref:4Fe-4S dicluster domain-containing protein n=1 Tax=Neobacillus dielmonensis TaxID=1347369 RepID=UPI0005A7873E|nr:4Fe-4S dicluster domain-containing protein [Neobacillus dielmonensis]